MRRTSPCGIIHSFNYPTLPTLLFVLLCLPSFASARLPIPRWLPSASPDALDAPTNRLSPRQTHLPYPNEHVVLADCTQGTERHLTSQMAYYYEAPGPNPVDVALVPSPQPGKSVLWVNSKTNETFPDSGVWFAATLGHPVGDGQFAGYGQNGQNFQDWVKNWVGTNFTCWKTYQKSLYTWDNADCSMLYDCYHRAAPRMCPAHHCLALPSVSNC